MWARLITAGLLALLTGAVLAEPDPVHAAYEAMRAAIAEDDVEGALRSARRAHELALERHGEGSELALPHATNYGYMLLKVGHLQDANGVLGNALVAAEGIHGEDAFELVPLLVALGESQAGRGSRETAQRALQLHKAHRPDDESGYAEIALRVGRYLAAFSRNDPLARSALTDALRILEREHGKKSPELIPVLMGLGDAHAKFQQANRQKKFYDRAIEIAVEHDEPLQAADLRREAGLHLMILSASKLANRYLASAVEDYEKLLGAEHVKTAVARLTLARFHIATSKNKPAERLLLDALPVLSNDQNARNHELKALGLLVEIYERSGDSDQATTYCQAIGRMTPWVSTQDYQPIFKMAPAYPIAALQRGQQGYVIVEYTVDKNGVVRSPTVVASQGSDLFAEPSLEAARRFRYAPRYVDGEPVDVPGVQNKFTFNIQR